jgi:hypothetical protein
MRARAHDPTTVLVAYLFVISVLLIMFIVWVTPVHAHDIYTGVHGKSGQLCCGGSDCAPTVYNEDGGRFEFLTREREWVTIPQDRITFLPLPGDQPTTDSHYAHLCYRLATQEDREGAYADHVIDDIYFYCAFIPPGGV